MKHRKKKRRKSSTYKYKQTHLRPTQIPANSPYFHQEIKQRETGSVCFLFQNVDGLPINDLSHMRTSLNLVKDSSVSYLGLQETKLNTSHPSCISRARQAFSDLLPGSKVHLSSNNTFHSDTLHQHGGLLTATMRPFSASTTHSSSDPTSCIQHTILKTRDVNISVFNVYVPHNKIGPQTNYIQAVNAIRKLNLGPPDISPRDYIYEFLKKAVMDAREKNHRIIIGGDFNEPHTPSEQNHLNKKSMTSIMTGLGLVLATCSPDETSPPTYIRGKQTLDHIWISSDLRPIVTGYGYLPFKAAFDSDHRGSFLHLQLKHIVSPNPIEGTKRKLVSKNPTKVVKYLDSVRRMVHNNKLLEKVRQLKEKVILTEDDIASLQKIDNILTEIQLTAESELYKHRTCHSFSDIIHQLKCKRRYWRIILRLRKHMTTHEHLRTLNPEHLEENINLPRKRILKEIREVSADISQELTKQLQHRTEHLRRRSCTQPHLYKSGDYETTADIETLIKIEKRTNDFRKIRASKVSRGQNTTGSVEIPSADSSIDGMWETLKEKGLHHSELEWSTVRDKQTVEDHLLRWCTLHFAQAATTPLAQEKWLDILDILNESNSVEEILSGRFGAEEYNAEINQFLVACKRKSPPVESATSLIFQDFRKFFEKQDEKKSSSPSRLHYGHIKTLTYDEELLQLRFDTMNLAFRHNIILERWLNVWETLLAKESPRQFIHRFRNITIIEWDLQYLMKVVWAKNLMRHARPLLNSSQNAVAGKVPQSSVLSHKLALSTMLITGESSVIIANDATNCYDRILLPIAVIATLRAGLPKHAASFMLLFLLAARHHLLISGEQTTDHFNFNDNSRVDGTGQGTGWSPAIWTLVSDIMLTALTRYYAGMVISAPDGSSLDERHAEMYVDDSFQGVNETGVRKVNERTGQTETLLGAARDANQGFGCMLTLTGGKLNLEKTDFYHLVPEITKTRKQYKLQNTGRLTLAENFSDKQVDLRQLKPDQPYKMLGIRTEPADTNVAQINQMKKKCREWNARMLGSSLTNRQKWLSYSTQLRPALCYPLPAITATHEQLEQVLQQAYPSMKHSLSLPTSSPNKLLTFPCAYGGFGMIDLWLEHLSMMSQFCIQHVLNQDSVASRIKALLAYHQLEAGTSSSFVSLLGTEKQHYLTSSPLIHLLSSLKEYHLDLWVPHWRPPTGDTIMDVLLPTTVDSLTLFKLNTCRLASKAYYITDLLTVDGAEILPYACEGTTRESHWRWPTYKPPAAWWETWSSYIKTYISPLLPHKGPSTSGHQKYRGRLNRERTHALVDGTQYLLDPRLRSPPLDTRESSPSPFTIPCDLHQSNGRTRVIRPAQECHLPIRDTPRITPEPFELYLRELPTSQAEIEILRALAVDGELHAASDGSAKDGDRSTFAVCFSSTDMTVFHVSSHEAAGLPHDSGRAELYGLLLIVIFLSSTLDGLDVGPIPIYCDNLEALNFAKDPYMGTTPTWADSRNSDLKLRMKDVLQKSTVTFKFVHVKSHQDEETQYDELPFPAKLNYHCDKAAHDFLLNLSSPSPGRVPPDENYPHLFDTSGRITSPVKRELVLRKYRPIVASHLDLDLETFDKIDWNSHARTVARLESPALKKILWGQNPSRLRLHKMKMHPSPLCPLCDEPDSPLHFIQCAHLNSHTMFSARVCEMQTKAKKAGLPDHLINTITDSLSGINKSPLRQPTNRRRPYLDQSEIGWENFTKGRVARSWLTGKPPSTQATSADVWMTRLSKIILEALLMKWEVRCKIISESHCTKEREKILAEATTLWEERRNQTLLAQDRALYDDIHEPDPAWSTTHLRNWVNTRELATKAAQEVLRTRTPTLLSWLIPKDRPTPDPS